MSKAISVSTVPIFMIFSSNGRYLREFYQSGPVFPIPQGTLPWQPILWQNCGKINYPPALITLSFRNEMGYRYFNERINSANAAFILYENFVKFGPVVFELKWGRKWKLCCDSSEISRFSLFGILAFWNAFKHHNFDFSRLIGNHFCTPGENLVRFGLVTPEF